MLKKLAELINPDVVMTSIGVLVIGILLAQAFHLSTFIGIIALGITLFFLFAYAYPEWKEIYDKAHRPRR